MPLSQILLRYFLSINPRSDDAACVVYARGGGFADEEGAEEGEFGEFVVYGVEGGGENVDKGVVGWEEGRLRGKGGGGVEGEVIFEAAGSTGEVVGLHRWREGFGGHDELEGFGKDGRKAETHRPGSAVTLRSVSD